MAVVRGLVEQAGVGDDIEQGEIETGETVYAPCDLLIADPVARLPLDAEWAAWIEVNAVLSFTIVTGPTTTLDIRVVRLPDVAAAATAAAKVRATRCPSGEFRLKNGRASAVRSTRTVRIGSTSARLTTARVKQVDPESEAGMTYLPGDARVIFTHGPLLISIEALTLWPRELNSPAEITAMAHDKATALATAIVKTLPTASED